MNPTTFVPAGADGKPLARVCILGEPGAGKTRLAATFPDPLFLDLENGAGTALPGGVNRLVIPTDRRALKNVRAVISKLAEAECEDGRIVYQVPGGDTIEIGTLVIDSIDAIQQPVKMFEVLHGRTKMERGDWDTLLNLMTPLVLDWHALRIHVVVTAHTKRRDGEGNRPGSMDFSVQGSLRAQMPRWFSHILHIVAGPGGKRTLVTQPTIYKGYRYLAKDRHNMLADLATKAAVPLPADEAGYPDDTIARTICG
ncbi:MAG: AAA family ATPase [Anaerolineae bacterium]|nr:AAA family ATPase [Anaerolineae bacterium]